jgi:predicted DCC family thiol-disulfide oxidoreductase YuxK
MTEGSAILLFDGTCGFCAKSVQFVLRRERHPKTLRFASLQSNLGGEVIARHPELAGVDSVIWLEPGNGTRAESVSVRSTAVFHVLRYLGGMWTVLAALGAIIPRFVRDAVYDFVARHRHKIIRADASCLLPTPDQRARFIEWETAFGGASR